MGAGIACPEKNYLPALLSSSRISSRMRASAMSATDGRSSACKDASSLIEISAWSDRPLALAMASSFARRSGSSRIEYGGGRLSVFIASNLPMVVQSIQVIVWSTLYYHFLRAMFGTTKNYLGVHDEFGTEKTISPFNSA